MCIKWTNNIVIYLTLVWKHNISSNLQYDSTRSNFIQVTYSLNNLLINSRILSIPLGMKIENKSKGDSNEKLILC